MGEIEIRVAQEKDKVLWDMIARSDNGSLFHLWDFLKIMEKHTRFGILKNKPELIPIIGFKGNSPIAIFPIFFFKYPKYVFSPPPHTECYYLGPVFYDFENLKQSKKEDYMEEFLSSVFDYIKELKPKGIKIKSLSYLVDQRPFTWQGFEIEPLYDYVINLENGEQFIWDGFKKNIRKNIRNAEEYGILIEEGNPSDLESIYDSLDARFNEQNEKIMFRKRYLKDVFEEFFPDNLKIFLAKKDGKIISGILLMCHNKQISAWIGTYKTELKGIYPNEFLLWESIRWSTANGFKKFKINWANNMRLNKYKSQYNPHLELYFSASKFSRLFSILHFLKTRFKENGDKK